jgi:hypothetical protein
MRLQLLTVLLLFALLALAACSSMEPSSANEAFGNQVPADFNWRKFDELNPEIRLAQIPNYFEVLNEEWRNKISKEEGISLNAARQQCNLNNAPSIIWGSDADPANPSCETGSELPAACCNTGNANKGIVGVSIKIAKDYLKWTDEMVCDMKTATATARTYLYRFLLCDRHGEEIAVIDSLMGSIDKDSTIFYKNYIYFGKKMGLAYRECEPSELQVSRGSLVEKELVGTRYVCTPSSNSEVTCNSSCVCDYAAYEFCADKTTNPHTLYAIPK